MKTIIPRVYHSARTALPKALRTAAWLLKIILPVGLAVSVLQYVGLIDRLSTLLNPVFSLIGLPGESAIVFISSVLLNIYAAIAVITTLPLGMREITILALMCLISHNMLVETAIQKKTGSSAVIMLSVRLGASFAAAVMLNAILPDNLGPALALQESLVFDSWGAMLTDWLINAGRLIVKITLIVTGLMILQNILVEFNVLGVISKMCAPLMRILGLSKESSFLWFVAQILGLAYGSAVMIETFERKEIGPEQADLLNYHVSVNHSLLEDTLLFVAIGVPAVWITFPRVILAALVVWGVRGVKSLKMKVDLFS